MESSKQHISFFLPHIGRGGVAQAFLTLAEEFTKQGHKVDLLLTELSPDEKRRIPVEINIVVLKRDCRLTYRLKFAFSFWKHIDVLLFSFILPLKISKSQLYLDCLVNYLKSSRPDILISAKTHTNITAILASLRSNSSTKFIVSEHTALSRDIETRKKKSRWRYILPVIKRFYPMANKVITVSKCVEEDLLKLLSPQKIDSQTIYNPIPIETIQKRMLEEIDHPWLKNKDHIVLIAAGRLEEPKDYPTLLRAFQIVKNTHEAKLIILGDGSLRKELEQLARDLHIDDNVDMPGYVENPYAYMRKSDVFILSSIWEGLPTVLIEAMVCRCKIVSTDCECGPREILNNGEYGLLTPTGNPENMAVNISSIIDDSKKFETNVDMFRPSKIAISFINKASPN